jgi:hypothetical protein
VTKRARGSVPAAASSDQPVSSAPAIVPVVPSDGRMDPLDRIIGRAALQEGFRSRLLRWPTDALTDEVVPDGLREQLSPISAETLAEFATVALRGYRRPSQSPDWPT